MISGTVLNTVAIVMLEKYSHSRFTTITSHEQRARYKEEFNAEYSRYTELKNKIDQVTVEFNELKNQLASCPKRSDEYKVRQIA